jgi:hypothetical protein
MSLYRRLLTLTLSLTITPTQHNTTQHILILTLIHTLTLTHTSTISNNKATPNHTAHTTLYAPTPSLSESSSFSDSDTPQPQRPGWVLSASVGQPSRQSTSPSESESTEQSLGGGAAGGSEGEGGGGGTTSQGTSKVSGFSWHWSQKALTQLPSGLITMFMPVWPRGGTRCVRMRASLGNILESGLHSVKPVAELASRTPTCGETNTEKRKSEEALEEEEEEEEEQNKRTYPPTYTLVHTR